MSTRLLASTLLLLAACGGPQTSEQEETGGVMESVSDSPSLTALERGINAASFGRYRAAAGWFEESIARGESVTFALQNRAIVRAAQGRYDEAIEDATAAIQAGAGNEARLALAGIQVRASLFDAAQATLNALVGGDLEPDASSLMAVVLASTGEPEAALALLSGIGEQHTLDAAALNNLGLVTEQNGDFEAARDFYDRALTAEPDHYESWRNLGMLLMRIGEDAAARQALQQYLVLAPEEVSDRGVISGRVVRLRD